MTTDAWTVELPWPPKKCNPNARGHWAPRAKAKSDYRKACWALVRSAINRNGWDLQALQAHAEQGGKGSVALFVDFFPPDRRHRDDDNCAAAFKAGRDGLADALGIDDRAFRMHPFLEERPSSGGIVRVKIMPVPDA